MSSRTSQKTSIPARIVGGYEIIGGAIGAIVLFFKIIDYLGESSDALYLLNAFFGLALFLFCCYAGYRLIEGKLTGYTLSLWVQAIQIPKIVIGGFAYFFAAGLHLLLGLQEDMSLGFFLSTSITGFQLGFIFDEPIYSFSVNVIAISLCIYLTKLMKLRKTEDRLAELKTCPYCHADLVFDTDRFLKQSRAFCSSCNNVIRLQDLEKRSEESI